MNSNRLLQTDDMIFAAAEKFFMLSHSEPWAVQYADYYTGLAVLLESSGWKYRTKMTQTDKILKHLRATGCITQREAYMDYGIQSFHRRLTDLKEMGHNIVGIKKRHPITGQEYTRYYLTHDHTSSVVVRKAG